jgi:hypothetical protein
MRVALASTHRLNFEYETSDGFYVESTSDIIPIFNSESASIVWRDGDDLVFENPFSRPRLYRLLQDAPETFEHTTREIAYDENLLNGDIASINCPWSMSGVAKTWECGDFLASISEADQWTPLGETFYDLPIANSFVTASCVVQDHVRRARKFYDPRSFRVISHVQTLSGKAVLVPKSAFESILAVVRDHIFPSEFISLSREHSHFGLFVDSHKQQKAERERFLAWSSTNLFGSFEMSPDSWHSCAQFGPSLNQPN